MTAPALLIARHSARFVLREKIVGLLTGLFIVLVLLSAWLGWEATATVNRIYLDTAAFLQGAGQPVPSNPVLEISPLSLMRNMVVYVALIGALAAIVIGNQLVTIDRKGGVVPLIASRPLTSGAYATGKMAALLGLVLVLTGVAAVLAAGTLAMLPQSAPHLAAWARLAGFLGLSALYMLTFGLVGLGAAAIARTEGAGLLVPVTLWLALTFVLPAVTSNILPTAALNPISALAPPPDSAFFHAAGWLLGPLSLADAYKIAAAGLLDFLPPGFVDRSALPPLATLGLAVGLAAAWAARALLRMDRTDGDFDV